MTCILVDGGPGWGEEGCRDDDNITFRFYMWRAAWNKALSDSRCNDKFSFCFTSQYKAIWKENLVVN